MGMLIMCPTLDTVGKTSTTGVQIIVFLVVVFGARARLTRSIGTRRIGGRVLKSL